MHEFLVNLHMHTYYSDGHATHREIAQAAMKTGIDAVIITDHNVWVGGPEDYYQEGERRVLLLVGEEIHDQARIPQKNHLLVFGVNRELAPLADDPQRLINTIRQEGGSSFIAHPLDPESASFGEDDLSWEDWQVQGYSGLELWNAMSEFKSLLKSKLHALYYAFFPERIAHAPFPEVINRWNELLAGGRKVFAVGGTDAHQLPARMGPLRKTIFPYEFHFKTINTHILTKEPLSGEFDHDRQAVMEAIALGRCFIGYDLPSPTRGFRFHAQGRDGYVQMGEEISARQGVTLQIRLPSPVECRLIKDSKPIKTWEKTSTGTYITNDPGVYRVEAYIHFKGRQRGWIFSNPIFLKP